jgi:CrcB protein
MLPRWMVEASIVGAGGFIGAILRYGLSGLVHRVITFAAFPWGTLIVNVVGCFAIGALAGLGESRQAFGPEARLFLFIGLLGGFTTFSTFGFETFELIRDAQRAAAAANVLIQVTVGITAVWLGYSLLRAW